VLGRKTNGNPLNELKLMCDSLMNNDGVRANQRSVWVLWGCIVSPRNLWTRRPYAQTIHLVLTLVKTVDVRQACHD
jgi:hypothetical protein